MPALNFRPVPNCIGVRITASWEGGVGQMMNTLSFKSDDVEPTFEHCDAIAGLVENWCTSFYKDAYSNNVTITEVQAFSRNSPDGALSSRVLSQAGNLGASKNPSLAPLWLLHTATRGRSFQGKFYGFAVDPDSATANAYVSAVWSQYLTMFDQLLATSVALSLPLAVGSSTLRETSQVQNFGHTDRLSMQTRRRSGFGR